MRLDARWRDGFLRGDLARGREYYEDYAISELYAGADGWHAVVEGSEAYDVFVPDQDASAPGVPTCNCPRFEDGYLCKHIAAVCLAIEEEGDEIPVRKGESSAGGGRTASAQASSARKNAAETTVPDTPEALLATVSPDDLRAFLADAFQANEFLADRFCQRFGRFDLDQALRTMREQVRDAVREYGHRGFVDWHGSLGFERRYRQIMADHIGPLVERGDLTSALEMLVGNLECLQTIDIDDSNGFFTDAIMDVSDWLAQLLKLGDDAFAHTLFDRIASFIARPPKNRSRRDIFGYEAEDLEGFLVDRFADRRAFSQQVAAFAEAHLARDTQNLGNAGRELERVLDAYEQEVTPARKGRGKGQTKQGKGQASKRDEQGGRKQAANHDDQSGKRQTSGRSITLESVLTTPSHQLNGRAWQLRQEVSKYAYRIESLERDAVRWTLVRLRALQAAGASENLLREAAGVYIVRADICEFFVRRALKRKNKAVALALLRDCKAWYLEQGKGYPTSISQQLADLLEDEDVAAYREELLYLVDHADIRNGVGRLPSWERLRRTYAPAEWETACSAHLSALTNSSARHDCLAAEGLWEQLMDEVERSGLWTLSSYEEQLAARFPDRVIAIHVAYLSSNNFYPGSDRRGYREFAKRLRHIKTIPGGDAVVANIVADLRARYPRRPALMEELGSV